MSNVEIDAVTLSSPTLTTGPEGALSLIQSVGHDGLLRTRGTAKWQLVFAIQIVHFTHNIAFETQPEINHFIEGEPMDWQHE